MSDTLLEVAGLDVYYGAVHALKGVTLEVRRGEIVTLIGANGAGKSTLLRAISALVKPRAGAIVFDGRDLTKLPPHEIVAAGVSHAPEGRAVFAGPSVGEDMERMYGLFPRLRERKKQPAGTLSGGEQQMLAIARALMSRPRLLLLDEPSLGLAPLLVKDIFSTIVEINREGTTILLVEQNANQALHVAHRGYVLETGRVALADTAANLLADPAVKEAYLGG